MRLLNCGKLEGKGPGDLGLKPSGCLMGNAETQQKIYLLENRITVSHLKRILETRRGIASLYYLSWKAEAEAGFNEFQDRQSYILRPCL